MNINKIAQHLNSLLSDSETGLAFDCLPIDGDVDVLQINVVGREEIPVFLSITENQVLCVSYLWGASEVKDGQLANMHTSMLEMNIPMPLSSFAKIGDKYAIFGALSINSTFSDIEQEISTLSNNALEIIEDMNEFLI